MVSYYFNFDVCINLRCNNLIILLSSLSILVLLNSDFGGIYGEYEPPYALSIDGEVVVKDMEDCGVSFVFVPDGRIFCGELKGGKVRVIEDFQMLPEPMIQLDVFHESKPSGRFDERGLTGLTIDPDFQSNHYVYLHWTYMDSVDNKTYNRVARFTETNNKLTNMTILLDKVPSEFQHNGGPLEFGPDGKLYVTGGEATKRRFAQDIGSPLGKIFRINSDGSIPEDNPFPGLPYYTLGHRNSFGIGFHPITKIPYITENGPTEDDEINILIPGKNYGWPNVTGRNDNEGFVQPLLEFTPTIAPTELIFYTGDRYPGETNNLFFLSYAERALYRVVLKPANYDEVLTVNSFGFADKVRGIGSITDIELGPDGYLYMSSFRMIMKLIFTYSNITTTVSLDVQPNDEIDGSVELSARVLDYFGNTVRNARIDFFDSDKLIASALSNDEGISSVEYITDRTSQHVFIAKFEDDDIYESSYSAQRVWDVDRIVSPPSLEATTDGNIKVRLSWNPSQPMPELPTKFSVEFVDSQTNDLLDNIQYDFTLIHGNTIIFSKNEQKAIEGQDMHEFTFDAKQMGSVQVLIENIDNKDNDVTFTINVVPEFPAILIMLIMSTVMVITTALVNYKRFFT